MKKMFCLSLILLAVITSYGEQTPRGVSADRRVKLVNYDPNNVVVLQGRYGYQTQVVFAPGETVQNVSIGDSLAWQAIPVSNNLFIKPVAPSNTNMTVLTSSNSYNFQLNSTSTGISPTYKLQFVYPVGGYDFNGKSMAVATCDPKSINYKYSFTGDRALAPTEAYDCGQFTYFKFRQDGMSRQPAIFVVGNDRKETLVNYHMDGDYTVINSIAKQFTLRNGSQVTSVYNDYAIGDWKKVR
jgi:P-type conjugative transfer protein VirB9